MEAEGGGGGAYLTYSEIIFYLQISEGKSISSKVLIKKLVDVCRCHLH